MVGWRIRTRRLERSWLHFTDSIWFYPVLLGVGAILLFLFTNSLDQGHWFARNRPFLANWVAAALYSGDALTAQYMLATVATMWATIIGISFSVTLVTVQLTATKYIAQVLPLFERDRVTQLVLGVYLGTVVYALLVLRTVRQVAPVFVPHLGVGVTLVLAILALGLLILFISNTINFVRPGHFLELTSEETRRALGKGEVFRNMTGLEAVKEAQPPPEVAGESLPIFCRERGVMAGVYYLELFRTMLAMLGRLSGHGHQLALHVYRKPGDRLKPGDLLAHLVVPPELLSAVRPLSEIISLASEIRPVRRHREDADYGIEVLAGVTVKGVFQGDLDVAFEGVDYLFGLLPMLANQPEVPGLVRLRAGGNEMLIDRPALDLLGKGMRELTLITEVALVHGAFRPLVEGISRRLVTALRMMGEAGDWSSFMRVADHALSWYQSAFFHMQWLNGMRHLAGDLADLALWLQEQSCPEVYQHVHRLMRELRDQFKPDSQASEAFKEAFRRLEG